SAIDVLLHATFLHGLNPHTAVSLDPAWWSLTPEVVFYCLLPFIVLKLPRASQCLALFGVCALVALGPPLYAYMMQTYTPTQVSYFWHAVFRATEHLYIFLAGVLLRMLVEYLNSRPAASWLRLRLATALFLISAVATVALLYLGLKHPLIAGLHGEASSLVVGIPFTLIVIAFFASAVLGSPLLRAVLSWRFLAFTGVISYSMFLLHHPLLNVVTIPYLSTGFRDWVAGQGLFGVWAGFSGYALATLAIAFIVSYFSYRYGPTLRH
ncbi:MAG: acyltransferase, partial [Cyanobacteria bacterium Co-bin8]|nr:acyltransferase [Cyanobacteria bacterium Co-bin8]